MSLTKTHRTAPAWCGLLIMNRIRQLVDDGATMSDEVALEWMAKDMAKSASIWGLTEDGARSAIELKGGIRRLVGELKARMHNKMKIHAEGDFANREGFDHCLATYKKGEKRLER